jgi:hypothetical protein
MAVTINSENSITLEEPREIKLYIFCEADNEFKSYPVCVNCKFHLAHSYFPRMECLKPLRKR